jgi:hypothetical protein
MKRLLSILVVTACTHAPPPTAPTPSPPAHGPGTLAAIDVYGAKHAAADEIIATAGLAVGSPFAMGDETSDEKMAAATERLKARYHFAFVELSPISYFGSSPDAGKVFITIDVVEPEDAARLEMSPAPTGEVADPEGIVAAWLDYEKAVWPLMRSGQLKPPFSCKGGMHCALGFKHPDLEKREDLFIAKVPDHVAELAAVLHGDRDAKKRAAAAFALAYGRDRAQVVEALVPSIGDPESVVRNNVIRVLVEIQHEAHALVVPLPPLLRAMTFPTTTDRNKAAYALSFAVKVASAEQRAQVIREVGDILVAMAAMKQPNNRDPALDILKALSGEDHGTDVTAWRAWLGRAR